MQGKIVKMRVNPQYMQGQAICTLKQVCIFVLLVTFFAESMSIVGIEMLLQPVIVLIKFQIPFVFMNSCPM